MSGPLEDPPQQEPLIWFVINHQNPGHPRLRLSR